MREKYYIATREIEINGFLVNVYFKGATDDLLTFNEDEAIVKTKDELVTLIVNTYGILGWEFIRVISNGVL